MLIKILGECLMINTSLKYIFFSIVLLYIFFVECPPAGLRNLGNTCYMNATLQALFASKRFNDELSKNIEQLRDNKDTQDVFNAYWTVYNTQKEMSGASAPHVMTTCITNKNWFDNVNNQNDAQELLGFFLNNLVDLSFNVQTGNLIKESNIGKIFSIPLEVALFCSDGGKKNIYDYVYTILLEFPDPTAVNVTFDELFKNFTKKEKFAPGEGSRCGKYDTLQTTDRQTWFLTLPEILIVCPKRFKTSGKYENFTQSKITTPINYSFDTLEIKTNNNSYRYKPFACVLHLGTPSGGHYKSVVRYAEQWFECDDSSVTPISFDQAKNEARQNGYIYFFERIDTQQINVSKTTAKLGTLMEEFQNYITKIYLSLKY